MKYKLFSSAKSAYSSGEYKPRLVRSAAAPLSGGRLQERNYTKLLTSRSQSSSNRESKQTLAKLFHRDQIHNPQEHVNVSVNSIISPTSELFHTNLMGNPEQNSARLPSLSSRPLTCCTKERCARIPPFVQLDTLRQGECFVSKLSQQS